MSNMKMTGTFASVDMLAVLAGTAHPALITAQFIMGGLGRELLASLVVDDADHCGVRELVAEAPNVLLEDAIDAAVATYETWKDHPRLGHEALINEVRAADVSFNKAVVAVQNVASSVAGHPERISAAAWFAQLQLLLASIRVIAILRVVGFDRAMAALVCKNSGGKKGKARVAKNASRGGQPIGEKHLTAKAKPLVVALAAAAGTDHEAIARQDLDALRATPDDQDAVITKLMAMEQRDPSRFAELAATLAGSSPNLANEAEAQGTSASASLTSNTPAFDPEVNLFLNWLAAKGSKIAYLLKIENDEVVFNKLPDAPHVQKWAEQYTRHPDVQKMLRKLHDENRGRQGA